MRDDEKRLTHMHISFCRRECAPAGFERKSRLTLGGANAVENPHTIRFIRLRKRPYVAPRFRRDGSVAMAIPAAGMMAPVDAFYTF